MKTRIFSVLGLLLLCGVITTWGSKASAATQPAATSEATLSGNYSCVGTGTDHDGDIPFTLAGVLRFVTASNTTSGFSPQDSNWSVDLAGFGIIDIPFTTGNFTTSGNGFGALVLGFGAPGPVFFPFTTIANWQVVMDSIDSQGTAHGFRLTLQPPLTFLFWVAAVDCRAQSQALGNPLP